MIQKPGRTLKHDPECSLKRCYALEWWFNGVKNEQINTKRIMIYDMSGLGTYILQIYQT